MEKSCKNRCPNCGTENIIFGDKETETDYIVQEVRCNICGQEFIEEYDLVYRLTQYEPIKEEKEEKEEKKQDIYRWVKLYNKWHISKIWNRSGITTYEVLAISRRAEDLEELGPMVEPYVK